jgi:hypothetical protein
MDARSERLNDQYEGKPIRLEITCRSGELSPGSCTARRKSTE